VASVALLTYDILHNLPEEIQYMWSNRWTTPTGLYVVARYAPWILQLALLSINADGTAGVFTIVDCQKWMILQAILLQVVISTVDIILLLRVWAMYGTCRRSMLTLGLLFCVETAYMCYALSYVTPRLQYTQNCFVTEAPRMFTSYWMVSLGFETVLFILTIFRFLEVFRVRFWSGSNIIDNLVTDGTWAYTLIFGTMLVNAMLYRFIHSPMAGICFTWLLTVLSFTGSRLVLNLR
ncbi:hypothetical protein K474DRAFT_1560728, partial [Panus rudis PR-1116 ss-1]